MAHLRDDFQAGAPVSQVPASWFNAVAKFVNGLIPGRGVKITRSAESTVIELNAADIATAVPNPPAGSTDVSGKMTETYVADDTPPVTAVNGATAVWTASADGKGYVEDVIVASDRYNAAGTLHRLWYVRKHYSADGRLIKVSPMAATDYVKV